MTDRRYKGISLEVKAPYGLLHERMGLSARNGWLDDNGRVFLYFTREEAMSMLDCGKDKPVKQKKLKAPYHFGFQLKYSTGEEGFEPPLTVLETVALPLNYSPKSAHSDIIPHDCGTVNYFLQFGISKNEIK